jgi:hypothetical protein
MESLRVAVPFPRQRHAEHLLSEHPWHILQSEQGPLPEAPFGESFDCIMAAIHVSLAILLKVSNISCEIIARNRTKRTCAMSVNVVKETSLPTLTLAGRGKVRDVYQVEGMLLIVSTDRLSAFDVILPDPIPYKGKVLNNLSLFWMRKTKDLVPNHLITADVSQYPEECKKFSSVLDGRSMLVKKASAFPVECVARGYII